MRRRAHGLEPARPPRADDRADHTRTAPIDVLFRVLHGLIAPKGDGGGGAKALDVLIAPATHPPMTEEVINARLRITPEDRAGRYAGTNFFNHHWDDPAQLVSIGAITEDEVSEISGGLMREHVDIAMNKLALDYDLLLIVGPTFPHWRNREAEGLLLGPKSGETLFRLKKPTELGNAKETTR